MPLAAQIAKLLTKGAQDLMSSPTGAIMKHSPTLRELTPEQEAASFAPVRTSSYDTPEPTVADTPPTTPIDTPEINEVPPVRTEMDDLMSPAGGKGKGGEGTNWEDTAPLEEIEKFYKLPENQRQAQTPQLKEAAQALLKGDIDKQDFDEIADTFYPSKSITEMPEPPHVRRIEAVLGKKVKSRPVVDETISKDLEGERVGTRLDIPAYNTYDTWVVTIHGPGKGGKALHYSKTAYLKNVTFMSDESKALKVATEDTPKNSFARMEGDWKDIKPDAAYALAEAELNKPNSEWVQIGMNPYKHSYFYDKKTMQPILSAGEVIQVGPLVLARNVVRGKSSDFTFNKGGVVDMRNGGKVGAAVVAASLMASGGQVMDMRNGGVVGMAQGGTLPPIPRMKPSRQKEEDVIDYKTSEEDGFNPEASKQMDALLEKRYAEEKQAAIDYGGGADDILARQAAVDYGGFEQPAPVLPEMKITQEETEVLNTPPRPTLLPSGSKKNNPGNLELSGNWAGMVGTYGNERRLEKGKSPFAKFSHPVMGLRALARDFKTKIARHKGSIKEIFKQYAPENENKTQEYINFVQKQVGKKKITEEDLGAVIRAVIKFENKKEDRDYYLSNPKWVQEGIELSEISMPVDIIDISEARDAYTKFKKEQGRPLEKPRIKSR